mmetsp:Transcript_20566/g.23292  ORF Transcript_20566/g.23292 Transcript_20566/m.23292 type:complete len:483 (+) Transcript_20566:139-1587(+)
MSSVEFESFYREIFTDLSVSREESDEIKQKFEDVNPPPDKLIWLRAASFRIGSEFLTDDETSNISLLRSINAIVHALEITCMRPKIKEGQEEEQEEDQGLDMEEAESLYRSLYEDLSVDRGESQDLHTFLNEARPSASTLVKIRAAAFRIGAGYLTMDQGSNIALFKSINSIVHTLEMTCMEPKPFVLKVKPPASINVGEIGMEEGISKAAQYLWDLDVNRLTPDEDYVINVQKGKKPFWKEDKAEDPLFTSVDSSAFLRSTYKAFIALLDNYTAETGTTEYVSRAEKQEIWTFLRAIMQSGPMQFCHKYCVANGSDIPVDSEEFMKLLYRIWFQLYTKDHSGDGHDSSGFEHVFVGEIKNGKVSGFHNWIYFYLQERKGNVDYKGYIKPRNHSNTATNDDDHVLTLQFTWHGIEKTVGTSFIGVSPEFEMALYTMCFLVGGQENIIDLNTGTDVFKLNCKIYRFARDKIGTSFVEAMEHFD